jgi:hypothetical protein
VLILPGALVIGGALWLALALKTMRHAGAACAQKRVLGASNKAP